MTIYFYNNGAVLFATFANPAMRWNRKAGLPAIRHPHRAGAQQFRANLIVWSLYFVPFGIESVLYLNT